jgi:hypothetical protein
MIMNAEDDPGFVGGGGAEGPSLRQIIKKIRYESKYLFRTHLLPPIPGPWKGPLQMRGLEALVSSP